MKDGEIAAYFARPAGGKNLPTVILVHEIWSVHEYFQDLAGASRSAGYLAVAPDLYARQGDVSKMQHRRHPQGRGARCPTRR